LEDRGHEEKCNKKRKTYQDLIRRHLLSA